MSDRISRLRVGIQISGSDARTMLERIEEAEAAGIDGVWLTSGGTVPDPLAVLAAAARATQRISLGTSIVPILPRHPVAMWQSVMAVQQLSNGRLRLGLGPSTRRVAERMLGIEWHDPLQAMREYIIILKQFAATGKADFDGKIYRVHERATSTVSVPILMSALRRRAYRLAGELADGAISWVAPLRYLRETALPALEEGAGAARRPLPPLVVHLAVALTDDRQAAYAAFRKQLGIYPRIAEYNRMFRDIGYENRGGLFEEGLLHELILAGSEETIADGLHRIRSAGFSEVLVSLLDAGDGTANALQVLGKYCQ